MRRSRWGSHAAAPRWRRRPRRRGTTSRGTSSAGAPGELPEPPSSDPPATNPFVMTAHDPLSTFAADVDTASYDVFRRDVNLGSLPAPSGVLPSACSRIACSVTRTERSPTTTPGRRGRRWGNRRRSPRDGAVRARAHRWRGPGARRRARAYGRRRVRGYDRTAPRRPRARQGPLQRAGRDRSRSGARSGGGAVVERPRRVAGRARRRLPLGARHRFVRRDLETQPDADPSRLEAIEQIVHAAEYASDSERNEFRALFDTASAMLER